MLKQMKKTLGILLVVCFLMSVTIATVSAEKISTESKISKKTTMFNETSTNITKSTGDMIVANEIAMKKGMAGKKMAMKTEDGDDLTDL